MYQNKLQDLQADHRIDMTMLAIVVTFYWVSMLGFSVASFALITIWLSSSSAILSGKIAKINSHSK